MIKGIAENRTSVRNFSPGCTPNGVYIDFWATRRPLTKSWGSGDVWDRICKTFGIPDAAFGVRDNIPDGPVKVDLSTGYNWISMPFEDKKFEFGYWDPPYFVLDKDGKATRKPCLYKKEGIEIWRCCKKLAILHTYVWPTAWLKGAKRVGMVAITMGPMKAIRILNVFNRMEGPEISLKA